MNWDDLTDVEKRTLYSIGRLSKDDPNGATPTAIATYLDLPVTTATTRIQRLRRAGLVHARTGYEVAGSEARVGAEEVLRRMEREISGALDGNVTGFRLELRLRQLLPEIRSAIDEVST